MRSPIYDHLDEIAEEGAWAISKKGERSRADEPVKFALD
jgi:hypothetical protein